jgi:streptogramin lyase
MPNTFYVLDPNDGHILRTFLAPVTLGGAGLANDGQYLWGCSGGTDMKLFAKMDPSDGSVVETYPLPVPEPTGITFDGASLWVSQIDGYSLAEVDPKTGSIIRTMNKEPYYSFDLAWDGKALWLSAFDRGDPCLYYLYQLDPSNGATLNVFGAPPGPGGMVIKDGLLYVTSWWDNLIYVYEVPEPTSVMLLTFAGAFVCRRNKTIARQKVSG